MGGPRTSLFAEVVRLEPWNLDIRDFHDVDEFKNYQARTAPYGRELWWWHQKLGDREGAFELSGICDICGRFTEFSTHSIPTPNEKYFKFRTLWWGTMNCRHCGLSTLDRSVLRTAIASCSKDDPIYHVGHYSLLRRRLSEHFKYLVSSQYEIGRQSGEIEGEIRYEDLTNLSFASGTFKTLVNTEILEHIPDYKLALREMARVLQPNGHVIMTFPWLCSDVYEHVIRAEIRPDGTINHILPPEYHGDPASKEGILSFRAFGWKILDEMRENGFSRAYCKFIFGPLHGYMTAMIPVIIGVR